MWYQTINGVRIQENKIYMASLDCSAPLGLRSRGLRGVQFPQHVPLVPAMVRHGLGILYLSSSRMGVNMIIVPDAKRTVVSW